MFILVSFLYFGSISNIYLAIIPLALVEKEMTIVNSGLRASLAICHLLPTKREWNNC